MDQRRVLVSWIGHADLRAAADDLGSEWLNGLKMPQNAVEKPGPLKTAISLGKFERVHLLSNYPEGISAKYGEWLGCEHKIHQVELVNPTDYDGIFRCSNSVLAEVYKEVRKEGSRLCILLTPGTPAMIVVLVLLGKSRFPADFYQTGKGDLHKAAIPEHLFEKMLPDLIRDRDIGFQHLAYRNPSELEGFEQVLGQSDAIKIAVGRAQRAAFRDVSVLLLGESGTGKEVFAQAIHKATPRRKNKPFEAINCAAIPKEMLESELFGHVKGAFSGALKDKDHKGAFSRADGGTLFLDEIGECPPSLQAKLLRVLQPPPGKPACHREFQPVGGEKILVSNVRIIAATNRDLQKEIKANRFRDDLYYRIAVITLRLPALRERRSDIPILADAFMGVINKDFKPTEPGYRDRQISNEAFDFIRNHDWPGNVRQLNNALVQAAVMSEGETIHLSDIRSAVAEMEGQGIPAMGAADPVSIEEGFDLNKLLDSYRARYVRQALIDCKGNKAQAARILGLKNYQNLVNIMKKLKIEIDK